MTTATSLTPAFKQAKGTSPVILSEIYQAEVELAVWQRSVDEAVQQYVSEICHHDSPFKDIKGIVSPAEIRDYLQAMLPLAEGRDAMINDLALLTEMFSDLFDLTHVGIRLLKLNRAMCPKMHCDQVPCRLLTNYAGSGTEYQLRDHLADEASALRQLPLYSVALLKGQRWEGNEQFGLLHRSPQHSDQYPRLLFSLDFAG